MKNFKKLLCMILAISMVLVFAACGEKESVQTSTTPASDSAAPATPSATAETTGTSVKDTLVISTSAEPTSLDPQYGEDTTTQRVVMQISDTLIAVDENMSYIPCLAESWELSEDGLTYTFHLRSGVTSHAGNPLTSEDVAYTIERGKASTLVAKAFAAIDSVECPDEQTVVLHLAYASPIQLAYLSSPSTGIVDKKACEKAGDDAFGRAPVAFGPYQVVDWASGDSVTLKAFENYWAGTPAIANVIFKVYTDSNTAAIALQSGQVDVVLDVSTADVSTLENDDNVTVYTGESLIAFHLHLNCTKAPFDNALVRQAINYAVDTQAIIDAVFDGVGASKMNSFIPTMSIDADLGTNPYEFNADKAKELLAEAGYGNGFDCNILVTSGQQEKMAQVVKGYLANIGVNLNIEVYEWSTLLDIVNTGEYDSTILRIVAMIPDPDLSLYTRFQSEQVYNFSRYYNAELDEKLDSARVCPNTDERKQMYVDINNMLWKDAPTIPLCFTTVINATNSGLKGYHTDPRGFMKAVELSW